VYHTAPWATVTANRAISTTFRFGQRQNASVKGAWEVSPSACMRAKAGLSESFMRMKMETARRPAENRKGTRQPQASKAVGPEAAPTARRVTRITSRAAKRPKAAEV